MGTGGSQKLFVSSTLLLLLTVYKLLRSAAVLLLFLSSIVIFMVTALLNLLTACLPHSGGLAAPDFLLTLTPFLSNSLMQELTSIFIPFTGKLWNSLPESIFPPAYDLDSFKRGVSRHLFS